MFSFFKRRKEKQDIENLREELSERQKEIDEFNKEHKVIEEHFVLMEKWRKLKSQIKEDESLYNEYITVLKQDCEIHNQFVVEYYKKWQETVSYPAFKELALAYERTGQIQNAIDISREAIENEVVEHTSFENRIKRLEKKL